MLDKQRVIDELEMSALDSDKQRFLRYALQSYIKCLTAGDAHNLRIFRLISLWFDNNTNQEVNELIQVSQMTQHQTIHCSFCHVQYQCFSNVTLFPPFDVVHTGGSRQPPVL